MAERLIADFAVDVGGHRFGVQLRSDARAIALVGPSGSGKSTTLRVLCGLERRVTGTLVFDGRTWLGPGTFVPPWERRTGWVPQEGSLFPHLSVRNNLGYAGASATDVAAMAERLGVAALLDRAPRRLSGGERQRVALGRALLARPKLLLLDEPFAALDDGLRARLSAEIASLCRERDLPFLVVSHHPGDVAALADEVFQIEGGVTRRVG